MWVGYDGAGALVFSGDERAYLGERTWLDDHGIDAASAPTRVGAHGRGPCTSRVRGDVWAPAGLLARHRTARRSLVAEPWPRHGARRTAAPAAAPACGDGPALLAGMSTRDKLAQLLMVGVTGAADARAVVDSHHVGGIFIGSWTDLSMLSDGSLADIAAIGGPAAARGQRRRGGRPGVTAGPADRQPAVAARARGQPHARRGVQHRPRARSGDEKARHHHRLRARRRRDRTPPTTP